MCFTWNFKPLRPLLDRIGKTAVFSLEDNDKATQVSAGTILQRTSALSVNQVGLYHSCVYDPAV